MDFITRLNGETACKLVFFGWLAAACLCISLLATGCARSRTQIVRERFSETGADGVERSLQRETTLATGGTLMDGKNKLSDFKAEQANTTQKIGIGEAGQESTSDSLTTLLNGLLSVGRLMSGAPQAGQAAAPTGTSSTGNTSVHNASPMPLLVFTNYVFVPTNNSPAK